MTSKSKKTVRCSRVRKQYLPGWIATLLASTLLLAGCFKTGDAYLPVDGTDGAEGTAGGDGAAGVNGLDGQQGQHGIDGRDPTNSFLLSVEMTAALTATVTSVTLAAQSVVRFKVEDPAGRGAVGLLGGSSGHVRFGIMKLVPGSNGERDSWKNYINSKVTAGSTNGIQGGTERTGTLVDNKNGTYVYTFSSDLTQAKNPLTNAAIPLEPTLTHRLAIQISGTVGTLALPATNAVYDFVPNGTAVTSRHDMIASARCNQCHGKLVAHGSRTDVRYCLVCHNSASTDPDTGNSIDLMVMGHKIHAASLLAQNGAPAFTLASVRDGVTTTYDFSEVTYPQGLDNCRKCHSDEDAATPQGDNWKLYPTREACGSCHTNVNFDTHKLGAAAANSECATCHPAAAIETAHTSINKTPNNPNLPVGAYDIAYQIKTVTASAGRAPVVTFRILKDGAPLDFAALPVDLPRQISGSNNAPGFLVAFTRPQDGIAIPVDWNQLGKKAGQPASISLADLKPYAGNVGTKGTLTGPDAEGYYVATLTDSTALFPEDAVMRGVALQGYYQQKDFYGAGQNLARHAIAVIKNVTGDPLRRSVADNAKCGNCHEWFEGHGGNRVYTTEVCAVCHNPNLTSSGRTSSVSNLNADNRALLTAGGYDPDNPLTYPEDSNNLKDLIHGIHAADKRENPLRFVRNRTTSGIFYYDFSEVTFPGVLSNCATCHKPGTYLSAPTAALGTNQRTSDGTDATPAAVDTARTNLVNTTDQVNTPNASACVDCHDTTLDKAHMSQNGAMLYASRSSVTSAASVETCSLCHASGRSGSVSVVHGATE